MTSQSHLAHLKANRSYNNCSECRADTERQFVDLTPWRYSYIHEYLAWAHPCLAAIHSGTDTPESRHWYRKFRQALDRRITLRVPKTGRKYADGYLARLGQFPRHTDAAYLRRFASRGASCLDS